MNQSLFTDEDLPTPTSNVVTLTALSAGMDKAQSAAHKTFNRLAQKIAQLKQELDDWQTFLPQVENIRQTQLMPLVAQVDELNIEGATFLHDIHENKIFTKTERKKISFMIERLLGECESLLENKELKAVYEFHSGIDIDQEQAFEAEMLRDMAGAMFGDIPEEYDFTNPEDIEKWMHAQVQSAQEEAQLREEKKAQRKKSAKQIAAEQKRQLAERELSQNLRGIYRQLASQIHPDKELAPEKKALKTQLMQDANLAYKNNNLLELLTLQLKLDQIDQNDLNNIEMDKLKNYNTLLKRQVQEVEEQLFDVRMRASMILNDPNIQIDTPEQLRMLLNRDKQTLTQQIEDLSMMINDWKHDIKFVKRDVKEARIPRQTRGY